MYLLDVQCQNESEVRLRKCCFAKLQDLKRSTLACEHDIVKYSFIIAHDAPGEHVIFLFCNEKAYFLKNTIVVCNHYYDDC